MPIVKNKKNEEKRVQSPNATNKAPIDSENEAKKPKNI